MHKCPSALKKEAYTSPHLERYGNVRDLTRTLDSREFR